MGKPEPSKPAKSTAAAARAARAKAAKMAQRWAMARARFETDKTETHTRLAAFLGCSRQYVQEVAKRDGWIKAGSAAELARAAQAAAAGGDLPPLVAQVEGPPEAASAAEPESTSPTPAPASAPAPAPAAPAPTPRAAHPLDPPKVMPPVDYGEAAVALAVAERTEVLGRHRAELRALRGMAQEVVRDRRAPHADTLSKVFLRIVTGVKTIQEAERKAYGLDEGAGGGGDMPPAPGKGAAVTVRVIREGTVPTYAQVEDDEDEESA
jgi:hypothetical protein